MPTYLACRPSRRPAAAALGNSSCGATSRTPPAPSGEAGRRRRRAFRLGAAARRGHGHQGHTLANLDFYLTRLEERVVSAWDVLGGQRLVRARSPGWDHGLHLDHLTARAARPGRHDGVRLFGVGAQCTGARADHPLFQPGQVEVQVGQGVVLMAVPAARSCAQSESSATAAARFTRIVPVACARLLRSWELPGPRRRPPGRPACRGSRHAHGPLTCSPAGRLGSRVLARSRRDAWWPPGPLRDSTPPNVHEARVVRGAEHLGPGLQHRADLVRAHRRRHVRVLQRERAAEAAARLVVGSRSTRSIPRTARSSAAARRRTRIIRSEWQLGDRSPDAGNTPHVGDPQHIHSSRTAHAPGGRSARRPGRARGLRCQPPAPDDTRAPSRAGRDGRDNHIKFPERVHEAGHHGHRLGPVPEFSASGRSMSGPSGRPPRGRAVQQRHRWPGRRWGTACRQAGHKQCDPHGPFRRSAARDGARPGFAHGNGWPSREACAGLTYIRE